MINAIRFSTMNMLTLKTLPDDLASSDNTLLSMIMQLAASIGVSIAGRLLGLFGQHPLSPGSDATQSVFLYSWLCIVVVIALPAPLFASVPLDHA